MLRSVDDSREQTWARIRAERLAVADLLDTLTPEQWAAPSLCGAWTVGEVAAHLGTPPTVTPLEMVRTMLAARGSFHRANVALVARRASRPQAEVVDALREVAGARFTPPTHDWHAPYTDLRVHTLDIVVPLGLDDPLPPDGWPDVLEFLASRKAERGFVRRGRPEASYVATDVAWSAGGGPEVSGPATSLALALSGRPAGFASLTGAGVPALAAWSGH